MKYTITNVVVTAYLGRSIDLEKIINSEMDVSYEPALFPGLTLKTGKITVLLFNSGKIVVAGLPTDDIKEIKKIILEELKPKLEEVGIKISDDIKIEVENIVANSEITDEEVDLNKIYENREIILKEFPEIKEVKYRPERFPGCIIKLKSSISVLLFNSKKVVISGARSRKDIEAACELIRKVLKRVNSL